MGDPKFDAIRERLRDFLPAAMDAHQIVVFSQLHEAIDAAEAAYKDMKNDRDEIRRPKFDPLFDAIRDKLDSDAAGIKDVVGLHAKIDAAEAAYQRKHKIIGEVQGRLRRYVRSTEKACDSATINKIMSEAMKM